MTTDLLPDFNVGDTLYLEVELLSPVDPFPALDITGCTVQFAMTRGAQTVTKTLSLTDPPNGKCLLQLESTDTEDLSPGLYTYGFVLTTPSGRRVTIIEDRLELRPALISG